MTDGQIGLTANGLWQAGVRRTLPVRPELAWDFLLKPDVLRIWLGDGVANKIAEGTEFQLQDGTRCCVTVFQSGSHLRLQWQPSGYAKPAILQVRVIPAGGRTTFAFHQENLPDEAARRERLDYYKDALDQMAHWL